IGLGAPVLLGCLSLLGCERDPAGPEPAQGLDVIAAGAYQICAIGEVGQAYCWEYDSLILSAFADDLRFTAISTGGDHSCGIFAELNQWMVRSNSGSAGRLLAGSCGKGFTRMARPESGTF